MRTSDWTSRIVNLFCQEAGLKNPIRAAERVSRDLFRRLGTKTPPFQTENYEYAKLLEVPVIENKIPCDGELSLFMGGFVIQVLQGASLERKSFTVCHEIGHILILKGAVKASQSSHLTEFARSSRTAREHKEEEKLSNVFASNLLMPRSIFSERASAEVPSMASLVKLAKEFATSIEATALRILELDVWKCQLAWCHPEKVDDSTWITEIDKVEHSKSVQFAPLPGRGRSRVGTKCVLEAFQGRGEAKQLLRVPVANRSRTELWNMECFAQSVGKKKNVLAFLTPHLV